MADRIANIIVLSEDQEHWNLVRRYLLRSGHKDGRIRKIPFPGSRQSGSQYVREQFPIQVEECRGTLGRRASCLLVVITDADNLTVIQREYTLHDELSQAGYGAVQQTEPIVILVPKWQVETWIKCLLGEAMLEDDKDSDHPPVDSGQIKRASEVLFQWNRTGATPGATCVDSLRAALPRWRRLD